jgi:hypothetical protein
VNDRRGEPANPSKAVSNWLSLEDVFQRWRARLGSSEDAKDKLEALLCNRESRSAKRRIASGQEIPGTRSLVNTEFWRDEAWLSVEIDPDGGDHIAARYTELVEVYSLDDDVYSVDGHTEFFVRAADVERWERLYLPTMASPPAPSKERKPSPKKKSGKAKQPSRAGRPEEWDWEEGRLFARRELERKGSPRRKENQIDGWKSVSDLTRLVVDHLSKNGEGPDFNAAWKKVNAWIKEFELEQN